MKPIYIVSIIAIIVVIGVAGAYAAGLFYPPQPTTIRVGELQGDLHHLALGVSISNGYFTQNGLNVSTYEYASGPILMQHFVAGELDFAYVGVPPAMTARANAMALGNVTNLPVAVASANLEGSSLVVNNNTITSVADLNGKTIGTPGVGTIQDVLLTMYCAANNITLNKFASTNAQLPILYHQGDINGFIAWEPTPSLAIINYGATTLLTSEDMFNNHQCCVLVVNQNFLNAHPDIVAKMVAVHKQSINFINSNPAQAKLIAVNFTHLPAQVVDVAFNNIDYSYNINVPSVRIFLSSMINLGLINTLNQTQIDTFLNGFINTQFIAP